MTRLNRFASAFVFVAVLALTSAIPLSTRVQVVATQEEFDRLALLSEACDPLHMKCPNPYDPTDDSPSNSQYCNVCVVPVMPWVNYPAPKPKPNPASPPYIPCKGCPSRE